MALASLQRHALFRFQIRDAEVAARVRELRALLGAAAGEPDARELLGELVFELEERLENDASDVFLLAALQKFAQEVELLADDAACSDLQRQPTDLQLKPSDLRPKAVAKQVSRPIQAPKTQVTAVTEAKAEEDERCGVCGMRDSPENDPIVLCEICGVAVHQTCYRIDELPEGDWLCQPCARYTHEQLADGSAGIEPTHEIECQACLTKGGALVPSSTATARDGWVHLVCTMFLPELYVLSTNRVALPGTGLAEQQVFGGAEKLGARRKLRCCFCKTSDKGACGQCVVGKCATAFHPLCAVRNGIQVRFLDENDQFGSACLRHQPEFLRSQGVEVNKASSERTTNDANNVGGAKEQQPSLASTTAVTAAPKRKRSGRNPWSDDDDDEVHSVLDSESDPDDLDSDLSDSDVEIIDVSGRSADQNSTSSSKRQPSKRTKQSKLSFNRPSGAPITQALAQVGSAPVAASNIPLGRVGEDMTDSTVFAPVLNPPRLIARDDDPNEKNFQYVMVLCWKHPLGIGIAAFGPRGRSIIVLKAATTRNPSAMSALKSGIIKDNDEIVAFNDVKVHNMDAIEVGKILPTLPLPIRCWIRTRRREPLPQAIPSPSMGPVATVPPASTSPDGPSTNNVNTPAMFASKLPKTVDLTASSTAAIVVDSDTEDDKVKAQQHSSSNADAVSALVSAALSPDWPWSHYLRSDGKLAMNLFWRSLDAGFFKSKFNKREFEALENHIQELTGIWLTPSRPEYEHMRGLLKLPRRERVPAYLVAFRKSRKSKQHFLSSDIFLGVHTEGTGVETNVDESIPIAAGTTVTVAKRTWPGINKLGGAGRIKKVNEEKLPDGSKRYTYNVGYVLGGNEKSIERKYISVVDLSKEAEDKALESSGVNNDASAKPEVKHQDDADDDSVNLRLSFRVTQSGDDVQTLALPDHEGGPPKRRRFNVQVSVSDGSVYFERKSTSSDSTQPPTPAAKAILQHKHFDVKCSPEDVAITSCFASQLLRVDDCTGDEIIDADDDDESDEEEENTVKKELIDLQTQLRSITESNEQLFSQLTKRVNMEYASRAYRSRKLEEIQWRNFERMYTEVAEAKNAFGDSENESDANGADDDDDNGSVDSEEEDESFGGMFINRVKQEGNEVCVLCELSGGDFAATSCGKVVHPQCAMYTPETFFKDGVVHGVEDVVPDRAKLKCNKCGGKKGVSKIQCASKKCTLAYHVACAYVEGLLTREPLYQVWCPRHLKSSGMTAYLELPPHLRKAGSADVSTSTHAVAADNRSKKKSGTGRPRGRPPKQQPLGSQRERSTAGKGLRETPDAAASSGGGMTSSKTSRKRKRRESSGALQSPNTRRSRQASVDGAEGAKPETEGGGEIRIARRLDIDVESDDNEQTASASKIDEPWRSTDEISRIFKVNEIVEVQARVGPNINKLGGVAKVKAVKVAGGGASSDVLYDVAYVLDTSHDKGVPAVHVRSYVAERASGNTESSSRKMRRRT